MSGSENPLTYRIRLRNVLVSRKEKACETSIVRSSVKAAPQGRTSGSQGKSQRRKPWYSRKKKRKEKKRGSERRMYEESTGDKRHKPRQVLDSSRVSLFVVPFKFSSARHGSFSSLLSPCRMLKDHGERNIKETREAGEVENTQHNAEMDGGRLGLSYSRAKIYSRVTRSDRKCRQHATI